LQEIAALNTEHEKTIKETKNNHENATKELKQEMEARVAQVWDT